MQWYDWLLILLALGAIIGPILRLRRTARPFDLSAEQLKRIHERNAEMDAREERER